MNALRNDIPAPASTPSLAQIQDDMPPLPWFENEGGWIGNLSQPRENTADGGKYYGRELAQKFGRVGLWLNTTQPLSDKKPIAIQMTQIGLDTYDLINQGMNFLADGGHKQGRKLPLVMAGILLNDNNIKAVAGKTPSPFQEDQQTWFVNQSDVGRVLLTPVCPGDPWCGREFLQYTQADVGMAEWGIRHQWKPDEDNRSWSATYRNTNWNSMVGPVLAAELMGAKSVWNHDAVFAYAERSVGMDGLTSFPFYSQMWQYKGPVTPSTNATLSISKTGSGTVTGTGISCGTDCSEIYTIANNTQVTLTATPAQGSTFTGWTGGTCSGTGTCTVTMNTNQSVTASFSTPVLPFAINNNVQVINVANINVRNGAGTSALILGTQPLGTAGTIIGGPIVASGFTWWNINYATGIDGWSGQDNLVVTSVGTTGTIYTLTTPTTTGGSVSGAGTYTSGQVVTVTASPATGYTFSSWSGDCTGTSTTCTLTMNANKTATANFTQTPTTTFMLTAAKSPSTGGVISGIDAASTAFPSGTAVTLTAVPNSDYTFSSWSGDCSGTSSTCTLTMNSNKSATANFTTITTPSAWTLAYVDSQDTQGYPAIAGFDNNPNTFWKTQTGTTHPHEIEINTGSMKAMTGFTYLPRQDGSTVGNISQYEFYISNTNTNWGTPVATGIFANNSAQKTVSFAERTGQFIRLKALSEVNGGDTSNAAEVNITTTPVVTDTDLDGVLDSMDKCLATPLAYRTSVNIYGCPKPALSNIIMLNDANTTDYMNVTNLELQDVTGVNGKIRFLEPINLFGTFPTTQPVNFEQYIDIQPRRVLVNSSVAPQYNRPAVITFYNVIMTNPVVKRDGVIYATSTSPLFIYDSVAKTVTLTVNGFSTYDLVEGTVTPTTYTLTAAKAGTGSGFINGIDAATSIYPAGTALTLTATPDTNSLFGGWSGDCTGTGSCLLTMNGDKAVTATFTLNTITPPAPTVFCTPQYTKVGLGSTVFIDVRVLNGQLPNLVTFSGTVTQSSGFNANTEDQLITFTSRGNYTLKVFAKDALGRIGSVSCPTINVDRKYAVVKSVAPTGTPISSTLSNSSTFTRNLTIGATGNDVLALQRFLNSNGFVITSTGAGSPGNESTYFGQGTAKALANFQASRGISTATGYFGPMTRGMVGN